MPGRPQNSGGGRGTNHGATDWSWSRRGGGADKSDAGWGQNREATPVRLFPAGFSVTGAGCVRGGGESTSVRGSDEGKGPLSVRCVAQYFPSSLALR